MLWSKIKQGAVDEGCWVRRGTTQMMDEVKFEQRSE